MPKLSEQASRYMKKAMTTCISAEGRESEPAETNTTVLELIFLFFIIVLIVVSGIFYLNLAPAISERSDVKEEALGIYNRHKMKLDQLSKKYYGELVSAKKDIHSVGDK